MFHDIDSTTPATTPQPPVTTPPPPATTTGNNAKIIFALLWPLIYQKFDDNDKMYWRLFLHFSWLG